MIISFTKKEKKRPKFFLDCHKKVKVSILKKNTLNFLKYFFLYLFIFFFFFIISLACTKRGDD